MNYTTLISVKELMQCINEPNIRLIDCRFNLANTDAGYRAWREGCIPGAVYAHLDDDLSGDKDENTGRHPIPDRKKLAECFRSWGINQDTQIIAYDAMGGVMASRLWWLSRWLGHEKVAVLDGGITAWLVDGGEVYPDKQKEYPTGDFVPSEPLSRHVNVTQLQSLMEKQAISLIDARDVARFRGEQDNMDPVAGHVPGAINHPFMQNLDDNGRFKSAAALRESFSGYLKERNADEIVHMCGSGVTACHNMLAMQHAGIEGSMLYVGSWSEWIRDKSRPVATGGD